MAKVTYKELKMDEVKFKFTKKDILRTCGQSLVAYIVFNKQTKEFECWEKTINDIFYFVEPYIYIDKFVFGHYEFIEKKLTMGELKEFFLEIANNKLRK